MSWIYKIDSSKIILWVEFINIFIKNNFMSWIYKSIHQFEFINYRVEFINIFIKNNFMSWIYKSIHQK